MIDNFRTLISGVLAKVSSLYAKKEDVSEAIDAVSKSVDDVSKSVDTLSKNVPIITSAEVGQTVIVKAVDKNGKPTEWEAGVSSSVPEPTTSDNGKFLCVVSGAPAWVVIQNAEEAMFGG